MKLRDTVARHVIDVLFTDSCRDRSRRSGCCNSAANEARRGQNMRAFSSPW